MVTLNQETINLGITLLIILLGFILSRAGSYLITAYQARKDVITLKQRALIRHYRYFVMIITILIALIYLRADIFDDFSIITSYLAKTYEFLPEIILIVLLIVLALFIVNLITFALKRFFDTAGITEFMIEQDREYITNGILFFVRILLYILAALILLNRFGINIEGIVSTFGMILFAILIIFLLYIFFGTRTMVENMIAAIYIRSSKNFKLGQKIRIDEADGKIKSITNQNVTIQTDFGYNVLIPNKEFIKKQVAYRSIETDLKTLEKIKSYFVEQKPSFCGPASASMILKIFGYNITQTKLGDMCKTKVGVGTHPQTLINIVQDVTVKKVRGAWISYDYITDLKQEIRLWLSQGALVVVDYKKNILFPDAKRAHYSVVVAVESDELVILDPSGKKGGVYLAEIEKVNRGMDTHSELINGKRGYIVFAPEYTTAYHRLEEGLIYADPDLYKDLSNKLKKELDKILEKSNELENVLPLKVKQFIRKWKEKDKIARLWRPEKI